MGNRQYKYEFKKDENGNLSEISTYQDLTITKTSFKFPEQTKFSFGIAKNKRNNAGDPEGLRLDAVDYTHNNIVIIDIFAKHMKEEMDRVKKNLRGILQLW